jgi:hypothetical protein
MSSTFGDAVKDLKSLKTNVKLLKLVVLRGGERGRRARNWWAVMKNGSK